MQYLLFVVFALTLTTPAATQATRGDLGCNVRCVRTGPTETSCYRICDKRWQRADKRR